MEGFASSTIAVLCFKNRIDPEFDDLSSDLAKALWASRHGGVRVQAQYDDFVVFDLPAGRICLAHADFRADFPEAGASFPFEQCLVVTVGSSPKAPWGGPLFTKRASVRDELAARIGTLHQPDEVLLLERDEIFSETAYDTLIEQVFRTVSEKSVAMTYPEPSTVLPRASGFAEQPPEAFMPVLEARFDMECKRKAAAQMMRGETPSVAQPTPAPFDDPRQTHAALAADADGASAQSAEERASQTQSSRLRKALYPEGPIWDEDVYTQPLVHRAAIHALNASMMAFSLPVGAALLTLAAMGRESLLVSSRMTAVTGTMIGLSQIESAQQLLSYFG